MKLHTTNYTNAFIKIADDCPLKTGEVPPTKGEARSIANMQFDMLLGHPYEYTSDDVIFQVYAIRNGIPESEWPEARARFFSKGQPCMRTSPLTKRYGWGVHADKEGKIALYGSETKEYEQFLKDKNLKTVKAMRASR